MVALIHDTRDCLGTHMRVEVADNLIAVRCSETGVTYWFKRCASTDTPDGSRCHAYTVGTRLFCYHHRDERA